MAFDVRFGKRRVSRKTIWFFARFEACPALFYLAIDVSNLAFLAARAPFILRGRKYIRRPAALEFLGKGEKYESKAVSNGSHPAGNYKLIASNCFNDVRRFIVAGYRHGIYRCCYRVNRPEKR